MKRYRLDYLVETDLSEEELSERAEAAFLTGFVCKVDLSIYEVLHMPSFAEQERALRDLRNAVISKEQARRDLGIE